MSSLFIFFFFAPSRKSFLVYALIVSVVFIWVWVRTTLPRYRYDLLINLTWKNYLPVVILVAFYAGSLVL
jgi:NADH-quinone oxidoreductase subunit H